MKIVKKLTNLMRGKAGYCAAVIVAAGSSQRMNGLDKVMEKLGGEEVLLRSVRAFQENELIQEIVVVTREDLLVQVSSLLRQYCMDKVTLVVRGGKTRAESVQLGLEQVSAKAEFVAVHDAARPLVPQEVINRTVQKAQKMHAAAPAIPMKDTIKSAQDHLVTATHERKYLYAVQTPQVFDAELLRAALQQAQQKKMTLTDECSAVEAMGMSVYLTEGAECNLKITTPMDLKIAALWLAEKQ